MFVLQHLAEMEVCSLNQEEKPQSNLVHCCLYLGILGRYWFSSSVEQLPGENYVFYLHCMGMQYAYSFFGSIFSYFEKWNMRPLFLTALSTFFFQPYSSAYPSCLYYPPAKLPDLYSDCSQIQWLILRCLSVCSHFPTALWQLFAGRWSALILYSLYFPGIAF